MRGEVETSELYAELTALFEDASAMAADGQATDIDRAKASTLARDLRQILAKANRTLDRISAKSREPS